VSNSAVRMIGYHLIQWGRKVRIDNQERMTIL